MQHKTDSLSSNFYRHITDLPLSKFIEVSTTGNLFALTISGEVKQEELLQAWAEITEQYTMAIGSEEQVYSLALYKDIQRLAATVQQVEIIVGLLQKVYIGKLVTMLNSLLGTTFVFDVTKPEEYDRNLQRAVSRSKQFGVSLELKLQQYEALKKKQETGEGVATKEYFQSILLTLRQSEGIFFTAEQISVFEYCDMIRRLNKKVQEQQKARA